MSTRRRKTGANRGGRRRVEVPTRDFWCDDDGLEEVRVDAESLPSIVPPDDPTAMVRSLGPAPFPGGETIAEHYFAAVYQKAAASAVALAAASGLLAVEELTGDELVTEGSLPT